MKSRNWEGEEKSRTNGANKSEVNCRVSQAHQTQESPHSPGKSEKRAEQITSSEASNGDSIEP